MRVAASLPPTPAQPVVRDVLPRSLCPDGVPAAAVHEERGPHALPMRPQVGQLLEASPKVMISLSPCCCGGIDGCVWGHVQSSDGMLAVQRVGHDEVGS